MFDIFYLGDNHKLTEQIPFAKKISSLSNVKANTKMYWVIEPDIELTDLAVLEYRPPVHDQVYEHVWKWNTNNYGGIRLLPRDTVQGVKQVNKVVCKKTFAVLNTPTPERHFDVNPYATHVWCVDPDYKLTENINWAPGNFEPAFIHSFHLRGQLEYKYPDQEGGIKLYPREWKTATIKYHNFLDASAKYPVLFVKNPEDYSQRDALTDEYVWLIDQDYKINIQTTDWIPDPFEREYVHCFRMPHQLTEKYPHEMGGIRLVPRDWRATDVKIHKVCPVHDQEYDVFYTNKAFNSDTFEYYSQRAETEWFWVVDRDYDFNGKLSYVPAVHEAEYINVFKWGLEYRYPADVTDLWDNRVAGIYLVNKNFDITKQKLHTDVVPVRYDVFYTDDITAYEKYARQSRTDAFWLVDKDHIISESFKWVPPLSEQRYINIFKIPGQLQHRYPADVTNVSDNRCGGVKLVPKNYNTDAIKYQGVLSTKLKQYPIYRVTDPGNVNNALPESWMIDQDYQIDDIIEWIPNSFERQFIHTFHVQGQLQHKYPDAMGGVYWYPADPVNAEIKIHSESPFKSKVYPIFFVDNPSDYTQSVGECWLIDKDYQINQEIEWIPNSFERQFIHTFHVQGQLQHKYPDAMGGARWIPLNWKDAEIKIHSESPFRNTAFGKFESVDQGRELSKTDWFWVIDPEVDVLPDFDFDFVPETWDAGKQHVWQKLNPKTKRQYDYGGVMLCPKQSQTSGRPKYMRTPACVQREYPVYYLTPADYEDTLEQAYRRLSELCDTTMFWVVDVHTQMDPDFGFDYYPTQWDQHCVHVFQNQDGEHKNVRLVPKQTFLENNYTDDQIANNGFENLKLINTVASIKPEWPVIHLLSMDREQFINAIKDIKAPFVWTIDPDVKVDQSVLASGFTPKITNINKVHSWQKTNAITGRTHSYGGLRLWPTATDYSQITTDALRLNKIKSMQYVRSQGSYTKVYDVVMISYHEPQAEQNYIRLKQHLQDITTMSGDQFKLIWIKDVQGIFQAHQQAAQQVSTELFWVVDADAEVLPDFKFDYVADVYDTAVTHVWNSLNPVTGAEYGYGGIKLLPRELVLAVHDWGLDFTTGLSSRFKSMPELSCITRFNTDAFSTWRSAFRECVKLTLKDDAESRERLEGWSHPVPDAHFRHEAKRGAEAGKQFAIQHRYNTEQVNNINNFEWLKQKFHDV
jgi:hypothetical protein